MNISRPLSRLSARLCLAIIILTGLPYLPAHATDTLKLKNIGLTAEDAKTTIAGKDGKAGSIKAQNTSPRSGLLMRCWNYGRLVYESPVGGFAASSPSGNIVTMPGTPQKQILDMRSGLCVIE